MQRLHDLAPVVARQLVPWALFRGEQLLDAEEDTTSELRCAGKVAPAQTGIDGGLTRFAGERHEFLPEGHVNLSLAQTHVQPSLLCLDLDLLDEACLSGDSAAQAFVAPPERRTIDGQIGALLH